MSGSTATVQGTRRTASLLEFGMVLPRLVSWVPAAFALLSILAVLAWRTSTLDQPSVASVVLRAAAVMSCLGCVFLLDDASMNVSEASVITRRWRVGMRLALMAVTVGVLLGCASLFVAVRADLPGFWGGFLLESVGLLLLAAGSALVLQRRFGQPEPGQVAAISLIMSVILMLMLSARWPMFTSPGHEWAAAHERWAWLVAGASVIVLVQLRDPAARRIKASRWLHSARG